MKKLLIFENKDFGLLWFGQLISQFGDRIFQIAVMWYVLSITDSSKYVSYTMFFSMIPIVFLGAFSGVIVDRSSKKKIIVLSDLLRGLIILSLVFLIYFDKIELWHIFLAMFLSGCVTSIFNPAISTSVPLIVKEDKISQAMAYQSSLRDMSSIFGAGIGGLLVSKLGIFYSFMSNGTSFIFSAFCELPIKVEEKFINSKTHFFKDMKEGLKYVFSHKVLSKMLLLFMVLNFFGPPIMIIIPVMVKRMGLSAEYLGYFEMILAVGSFVGVLTVNRITPSKKLVLFLSVMFVFSGLMPILIGLSDSVLFILIIQFLLGLSLAYINVNLMIVFQKITPDYIKGRFFGIIETVSSFIVPLSFIVAGITIDMFGYKKNLFVMGIAIIIASLYFYFIPGIKMLDEE